MAHTSEFPFGVYWWILKNRKNLNTFTGDIISYMCTKKHNHMRCSSRDTKWDRIFCRFGSFFAFLTPSTLTNQKTKILKKWKSFWKCHHFKLVQQKNTIICLLTQIWSACTDIIFCHFRPFFAFFTQLLTPTIKIWKNTGTYYPFTHVYH